MSTELNETSKAERGRMRDIYTRAHILFLDKLDVVPTPENFPLPYDLCKSVMEANWTRILFAEHIVSGDLQETINQLHAWREWLLDLSIWVEVIEHFDENDAWTIQHRYVDPLAYVCLMQPSSVRDRFGHIATNAIHQANLNCDDSYPDRLDQDGEKCPLSRKGCEKQLSKIGGKWLEFEKFIATLSAVDSDGYRQETFHFRNLASHAIAPRLRLGVTNFVIRSVVPRTEMIQQPDGTYQAVADPTKKAISYGFGGTPPLDLRDVIRVNADEYTRAVSTFDSYQNLLSEILEALRAKSAIQRTRE